jgi:hypothetical protein
LIGLIVAILGIGAVPALTYATVGERYGSCAKTERFGTCGTPTPQELAKAEADAQRFLRLVVPPEEAVEIGHEAGRHHGPKIVGCNPLVFASRQWHVSGEPKAVMEWVEGHAPARAHVFAHGEGGGNGSMSMGVLYMVSSHQPAVVQSVYLDVGVTVREGDPTTLSAVVQVVPKGATCKHHGGRAKGPG